MTNENTNWKTYLQTGATATLAVALTHVTASVANASCADHWTTIGVAGAVGSLVGAYQAKGGSLKNSALGLKESAQSWKDWALGKIKSKS